MFVGGHRRVCGGGAPLPAESGSGSGTAGFPLVTLFINVIGALAIGVLAGLAGKAEGLSPELLLLLKVGVCGGFTTFSTFALETTNLLSGGKAGMGVLYILLSVGLCLLAVLLGRA